MSGLCNSLSKLWEYSDVPCEEAIDAEEAVIKAVIADGNYQHFHITLSMMYEKRAKIAMRKENQDDALKALSEAMKHAAEFDRMDESGIEQYTCPVLSGYVEDHRGNRKEDSYTMVGYVRQCASDSIFAPLHDHEDFRTLFE